MKLLPIFLMATAVTLMPATASALTLINEDPVAHAVEVDMGQGDGGVEAFDIEPGSTETELCLNGCVIRLGTGAEQTFTGDEQVIIRDGEFTLVE